LWKKLAKTKGVFVVSQSHVKRMIDKPKARPSAAEQLPLVSTRGCQAPKATATSLFDKDDQSVDQ